MAALIIIGILWIVPIYICYEQGKAKYRRGIAWGLFLGWLGVLALAVLPASATEQPSFELTRSAAKREP